MQTTSVKRKRSGVKNKRSGVKKKYRKEERLYSPKVKKADVKVKKGNTKKKRSNNERNRGQLGRFTKEQEALSSESVRDIKLVKVKDNTYLVKDRMLNDAQIDVLIVLGLLFFLAIVF